jgi:multiple sugar transport system substrate-binding protein
MHSDSSQHLARRREFLAGVGSTGATIALAGCTGGTGGNMGGGSTGGTAGTSDGSLSGTTITHLQYSSAQSNANKAVKKKFEEETGINVQIEAVPFGDLLSKTLTVLESGSGNYDVIDADMSLLPKFASLGGIHPLDKMVKNSSVISPDLFPDKIWKDAAIYGPPDNINPQTADKTYINQIPYQTNLLQGYHRTDLYGNANVKPPDTISEYIDVGKKLTKPGEGIHGMSMMAAQHASVLVEWKSEYYGTGQGFFKGEVVNPKADIQGWSQSWTPNIYNEQAVKSLEKYVERAQADYSPKSVTSWDWTDLTRNFVQGKLATAQAFSSTARTANNPDQSQVAGKVGYHIYPGVGTDYPGIKSKSDLPIKPVTRTPHYGSWCLAIPANSKKKEQHGVG